jgi:hypothetical protein
MLHPVYLYSNKNGLQITEDSTFNCSVLFIDKGINPLVAVIRKSILFEYISNRTGAQTCKGNTGI